MICDLTFLGIGVSEFREVRLGELSDVLGTAR